MEKVEIMKIYYYIVIFGCVVSCNRMANQNVPRDGSESLMLSNQEIVEMLPLLKLYDDPELNIHILYSERFNDSTVVLKIVQNQFLANESLGICGTLKYENRNVFVYDSNDCKIDIPKNQESGSDRAPFYIPDSPSWEVLVKKREGIVFYYNVVMFPIYDENLRDTIDW